MNEKNVVTKCCICGRQKTRYGWEFCVEPPETHVAYSHGFCASCYETELMKVKLRTFARAGALSA